MVGFTKAKYKVDVQEIIKNNPHYFGNKFLKELSKNAIQSSLIEMDEIYLLEKPFFEKYAFIGVFRMDVDHWMKSSAPLTQLGLYNAYKNYLTSTHSFYNGKLKEKIKEYSDYAKTRKIKSFYDDEFNVIDNNEYEERKELDRMAYQFEEYDYEESNNLTTSNDKSVEIKNSTLIDNVMLLRIIQETLELGVSGEELNESLKKTLKLIDRKIDLFKDDENHAYSIEQQWCVRVYGANHKGVSYANWFKTRQDAMEFMKKMLKYRSMSRVQSEMICLMP